jgi:hypothetical protein
MKRSALVGVKLAVSAALLAYLFSSTDTRALEQRVEDLAQGEPKRAGNPGTQEQDRFVKEQAPEPAPADHEVLVLAKRRDPGPHRLLDPDLLPRLRALALAHSALPRSGFAAPRNVL